MGKLIKTTERERELLHELLVAINCVEVDNVNYLPRFLEGVKVDLRRVIEMHMDYNNCKNKMYVYRETQLKNMKELR